MAKIMVRRILIILLLTACAALPLAACHHSGSGAYKYAPDSVFGSRYDPGDTWAIYWYICGGDLESGHPRAGGGGGNGRFGAASDDLYEMLSVNLPENVTVVIEMSGTKNWQALEIDNEHANKLIEANPFYSLFEIDSGAYRGVAKTVQSVAVKAALIVRDDLSEDLAYSITRALFAYKNEIAASHAMGAYLDAAGAMEGITVPLHPGAKRYYREIDVIR
jgi:hypothetical protein